MISKRNFFPLVIVWCACFLFSCNNVYFNTGNDVYKTNGTVYLRNGTQKTGAITILLENDIDVKSTSIITVTPAGSAAGEQLRLADIESYIINGSTYVPRNINLYTAGINHTLFVKRLSAENSKIQLYELKQKRKSSDVGEERSLYFISVPSYSATELIELHSAVLVPDFETKMSAFVADCPELAEKIESKTTNYFYNYLSPEFKKLAVIKQIIKEYDTCQIK